MIVRTYILVIFSTYCYNCLKVIPERATVKYVNEKYISNMTVNVRRASRRGEYVFNTKLITKQQLGNNVTIDLIIYEFNGRYNQYVSTLIELHYKWCEIVLHNKWLTPSIRRAGITQCPTPVGLFVANNVTFNGYFPFDVSFEKGKIEGNWRIGSTSELMCSVEVYVSFSK